MATIAVADLLAEGSPRLKARIVVGANVPAEAKST